MEAASPDIAVVIVNYRTPKLTLQCLAALAGEKASLPALRAIVVDGGSGDGSAEEIGAALAESRFRDWVSFLPLPINGGFGWANNQAMLRLARDRHPPELIFLLNPDAEVMPGAVTALVDELAAHPRCAAAGSQLFDTDGRTTPSAFRFPSAGRELINAAASEKLGRLLGIKPTVVRTSESAEADWVTGASVMLRSAALRESGLFDDGFFLYFDEVELMHRLHGLGWTVRFVPRSRVVHIEAASTGVTAAGAMPYYWYDSRRRYFELTGGRISALVADLGFVAGRVLGAAKALATGKRHAVRGRAWDLFRGRRRQQPRSVASWGEAPGRPPIWMECP